VSSDCGTCDTSMYDPRYPLHQREAGEAKSSDCGVVSPDCNASRKSINIFRRLFKDLRFATIFVASAIATFPLMVPPFFLPLYGAEFGLSTLSSAALVSGFNLSSALGRVLFGQLADYIGPVNALILAMISNGFALLVLWPVSMSLAPLIIFVIVSGISAGKSYNIIPSSADQLGAFFSLMPTTVAGYLLGPPIAGYLLQATGGAAAGISAYRPAMYYAGSLTVASCLMIIGMKVKTTKSLRMKM
jgi:MFS family permease